jgi:hypothetical protein
VELAHALHLLGALLALARGLSALVAPARFAGQRGLTAAGPLGKSELRAAQGAFLAALGAFALLVQDQVAFALLGGAFAAAGVARVVAGFLARELDDRVWRAGLRDGVLAVMLLYPG